jgi:hypothetical protein
MASSLADGRGAPGSAILDILSSRPVIVMPTEHSMLARSGMSLMTRSDLVTMAASLPWEARTSRHCLVSRNLDSAYW